MISKSTVAALILMLNIFKLSAQDLGGELVSIEERPEAISATVKVSKGNWLCFFLLNESIFAEKHLDRAIPIRGFFIPDWYPFPSEYFTLKCVAGSDTVLDGRPVRKLEIIYKVETSREMKRRYNESGGGAEGGFSLLLYPASGGSPNWQFQSSPNRKREDNSTLLFSVFFTDESPVPETVSRCYAKLYCVVAKSREELLEKLLSFKSADAKMANEVVNVISPPSEQGTPDGGPTIESVYPLLKEIQLIPKE